MLDTEARRSHLSALGLPAIGQDYVIDVENKGPARKVGERRKRNVIFEVVMSRLRVVLQAESLTGEFLFLNGLDARTDVLQAFDQPVSRKLKIVDSRGRTTTVIYTTDYLVVYENCVCAFEVKSDVELESLCKARPQDWKKTESGYRYLPAEKDFATLGIKHIVVATSELSAVLAANQRFLVCVRELVDTAQLRKLRSKMLSVVRYEESIRIGDLLDRLEQTDATPILQLIEQNAIFADLYSTLLADPRDIWVATTPGLALAASDADRFLTSALHDDAAGNKRAPGNPKYFGELARRYSMIHGRRCTPTDPKKDTIGRKAASARSLRRYKKVFRDSGNDTDSLEPGWSKCGNREIRISPTHVAYVTAIIRIQRSDPNDPSVKSAFKTYQRSFKGFQEETEMFHLKPVSRRHFYRLSHTAKGRVTDAAKKGGRRLANAEQDPFDPKAKTLLATRPFEVAHIDHYKTDLHLVIGYSGGKKLTQRAWLTAMVDGHTKEVLALWLSYANPSKKSCSMVIRDCVRRHGRCPELIVVDSGSDFRSEHFEAMLAGIRVHRAERPVEDPRFGKEVERMFGIFKEKCLRGLPGYGMSIQQCRKLSAAFKAQKNAELSLQDLMRILSAFAFEGYNILGLNSPRDRRDEFERLFGRIGGRTVTWDMRFLILTAIEAPSDTYTLWKGKGIRVYDRWYTSTELMAFYGTKNDISVKIEPFNNHQIYVHIAGTWITAANADKRYHEAISERRVIAEAAITHDLRGLLSELANVADLEMAAIVERNLPQRDPTDPPPTSKKNSRTSSKQSAPANSGICFDDVVATKLE